MIRVALISSLAFVFACNGPQADSSSSGESGPSKDKAPSTTGTAAETNQQGDKNMAKGDSPVVVFETSMGSFEVELYPDKCPKTVENFLKYVDDGFYAGTIFHRVIDGFVIQGGGFTEAMQQKPTNPPVVNEAASGLANDEGTIAMARTQDPNSATSQFYVNLKSNAALNPGPDPRRGAGYTAFGRVISGMDVVKKIGRVRTGNKGMFSDVPVEPVMINKASRKSK